METGWNSPMKRLQQNGLPQMPMPPSIFASSLRFVAHADLAQLDAGSDNGCQILEQRAEVDSAVGGKIEYYLAVVKGVFHVDELHHQLVLGDFFLTDFARLLFLDAVFLDALQICLGSNAHQRFERMIQLAVRDLLVGHRDLAAFQTARGFDDHAVARSELVVERVKVVDLAYLLEPDSDYLCHNILLYSPHSHVVRRLMLMFCFSL